MSPEHDNNLQPTLETSQLPNLRQTLTKWPRPQAATACQQHPREPALQQLQHAR